MKQCAMWILVGAVTGYGVYATVRLARLESRLNTVERARAEELQQLRREIRTLIQELRSPRFERLARHG